METYRSYLERREMRLRYFILHGHPLCDKEWLEHELSLVIGELRSLYV